MYLSLCYPSIIINLEHPEIHQLGAFQRDTKNLLQLGYP